MYQPIFLTKEKREAVEEEIDMPLYRRVKDVVELFERYDAAASRRLHLEDMLDVETKPQVRRYLDIAVVESKKELEEVKSDLAVFFRVNDKNIKALISEVQSVLWRYE